MSLLCNTIRFGLRGAGRDEHPALYQASSSVTPADRPALAYPFPGAEFAGGPKFAAAELTEPWCNVSHWRYAANFSGLGRSLSVNSTGPTGSDYSAGVWSPADPPSRFDLLAYTSYYSSIVVLSDSWEESLNDHRQIAVTLRLAMGHAKYYGGKWWADMSVSAAALQFIDTSGTGGFADGDVETTSTGYKSDPDGSDIGVQFLGKPVLMIPLEDGGGDVSFSASINPATHYEDWFSLAA